MSLAALIRKMAEAGASAEAIAIAVEAVEAAGAQVESQRAAARERKRRQRERGVTVTGQSRDEDVTVTDISPETKVSPTPPSKTQTPSIPPYSPPKIDLNELAGRIWSLQPSIDGKRRQTRPDVKRALSSAIRSAKPEDIERACSAYYALPASLKDGGQFAMGAARLLQNDRWREFLPGEGQAVPQRTIVKPFPESEIRDAVAGAMGADWVSSWLDPCTWIAERRAIVPKTGFAGQKLQSTVGRLLTARDITIELPA